VGSAPKGEHALPPRRARRDPRPPPPDRQATSRPRTRTGPRRTRPGSATTPATRKADASGNVCFAATTYRVGSRYRRRRVQVTVVGTPSRSASMTSSSTPIPSSTTATASTAPSPTPADAPAGSTPPNPRPTVTQVPEPKCQAGYRCLTGRRGGFTSVPARSIAILCAAGSRPTSPSTDSGPNESELSIWRPAQQRLTV